MISTLPLKYALPVNVETPTTVNADPTCTSCNLDEPETVNAAPTVAAAPTFKSFVTVAPIETVRSVAVYD